MSARRLGTVAHVTTVDMSLRYLLLNQLRWIQAAGYEVVGISAPGPHVPIVEAAGIRHIGVPMTRAMDPLADLRSLHALYEVFRRERFDLVHTHTPKPNLFGQLAARAARVPHVVSTVHGFYFHDDMPRGRRRVFVELERISARCSDVVLSQNPEDLETAVREHIAPRSKLRLLGNGIDLQRFAPDQVPPETLVGLRSQLGLEGAAPVVGFVGRLVAEKGLLDLFRAAARVRERYPTVRFLIVGPADPDKPDALGPREAQRHGLEASLIFAGLRQDMPQMYALMDIFVLPSHREGFPRAPMEAAAMAKPVIVTDVRGCRETLIAGETGIMFAKADDEALALAILRLLDDPHARARMGHAGRLLAEQQFDERRVFERVVSTYEALM